MTSHFMDWIGKFWGYVVIAGFMNKILRLCGFCWTYEQDFKVMYKYFTDLYKRKTSEAENYVSNSALEVDLSIT